MALLCLVAAMSSAHQSESTAQNGGAFVVSSSDRKGCEPSLQITTDTITETITKSKRILRYEVVERIVNQGTCCWKIFENRFGNRFRRGQEAHIHLGFDSKPDFVPSSVRKTKCKTVGWYSKVEYNNKNNVFRLKKSFQDLYYNLQYFFNYAQKVKSYICTASFYNKNLNK